jgi:ADP-heptose:LPS heptosyltransferase
VLEGLRADRKIALGRDESISKALAAELPVPVRYQKLLAAPPMEASEVIFPPRLVPREEDRRRADHCLVSLGIDTKAPILGLHPGNSFRARKPGRRWFRKADNRSWPQENWVELIRGVHRACADIQFVLFGSARDRPVNRGVERALRGEETGIRLADAAGGTDLPTAAGLLERFSLFVSTDTGPLHMAAALGVPLIGLYGPTRYDQTRPYPVNTTATVLRGTLSCQPCYGTPLQKTCRENLCMQTIRVEDVLERVWGAISSRGAN